MNKNLFFVENEICCQMTPILSTLLTSGWLVMKTPVWMSECETTSAFELESDKATAKRPLGKCHFHFRQNKFLTVKGLNKVMFMFTNNISPYFASKLNSHSNVKVKTQHNARWALKESLYTFFVFFYSLPQMLPPIIIKIQGYKVWRF